MTKKPRILRAYFGVEADERMFVEGWDIWECPGREYSGTHPSISSDLSVVGYRVELPDTCYIIDIVEAAEALRPSSELRQNWDQFAAWMRETHQIDLPPPRILLSVCKEPLM